MVFHGCVHEFTYSLFAEFSLFSNCPRVFLRFYHMFRVLGFSAGFFFFISMILPKLYCIVFSMMLHKF